MQSLVLIDIETIVLTSIRMVGQPMCDLLRSPRLSTPDSASGCGMQSEHAKFSSKLFDIVADIGIGVNDTGLPEAVTEIKAF